MTTFYDFILHLADGRKCYAQGDGEVPGVALAHIVSTPEYQSLVQDTEITLVQVVAIGKAEKYDGVKVAF